MRGLVLFSVIHCIYDSMEIKTILKQNCPKKIVGNFRGLRRDSFRIANRKDTRRYSLVNPVNAQNKHTSEQWPKPASKLAGI